MNWDALGAMAELVGAIGVIASLLYLARQIKHSAGARKASAEQDAIASLREFQRSLLQDDRLRVFRLGVEGWDKLEEDDQARFLILAQEMLRAFESMYLLYDHGVLSHDIWEGWQRFLRDYATSPGVQRYWSARRDVFSPSFRQFIDSLTPRDTGVRFPDLLDGDASRESG